MSAFILGLSCVLTLSWVSSCGYSFEEFGQKVQTERGPRQSRQSLQSRVTALVFERVELRDQVQNIMEEAVKLKSYLRHTITARARAEGREEKARDSLRIAKVELREVKDRLQAAQDDLLEARDGLQAA